MKPAPTQPPQPLRGVRIIDLTRLLPGPLCTQMLADLGADVIKVEDPQRGDYARNLGLTAGGKPALFSLVNRNKRGLRLDFRHPDGAKVLRRLAGTADIFVESFRPGVLDALGLGFDQLHQQHPTLVYCAVTGYGQDGPYSSRAGHDINYCALTGVLDQIGASDGPPIVPGFQIADVTGGAQSACIAILAALHEARASGRGRYLDVAMVDCTLAAAVSLLATYNEAGTVPPRGTSTLGGALPCYRVYATRDGRHLAVGALERKFWDRLCDALERPDLKPLQNARGPQADFAIAQLEQMFGSRSLQQWMQSLGDVDCCVTPVLSLGECMRDPHLNARQMFSASLQSTGDELVQAAAPVRFDGARCALRRRAPEPGEHSREILGELGFDAAEIADLTDRDII